MSHLGKLLAASWLSVLLAGCGYWRPNFWHPGPQEFQRTKAVLHDPYPDNDAGPEVVGGRPLEFDKPKSEPVRNQPYPNAL